MGISGSQKALMQARSGVARSGATRSNYMAPMNAVIRIWHNGAWADISQHVVYNGWSISLNINDEVDTATIRCLPSLPFVPLMRSRVELAFGSAGNVEFAGVLVTMQRTRHPGPDPRFWYDLHCIDWLTVFDAHFVLAAYPAQSATTTILDVVKRFTRGGFTTEGVASNLPTIDGFSVVNERPSTVLRRITNILGGGFYIDALRRVRAWSASIPSPIQETGPQPLTDTLDTLKTFQVTYDATQQRMRILVEGRRTATALGVPAVATPQYFTIPLRERDIFPATEGDQYARLDTQLGRGVTTSFSAVDPWGNLPGSTLTAPAAAGSTTLSLADGGEFGASGWCQVAGQVVQFQRAGNVLTIPASGYGSLEAPVDTGTQVVIVPFMSFLALDRAAGSGWAPVALGAHPIESPAVQVVIREDTGLADAYGAREGSDGYYEHLIQDGRYAPERSRARGDAELANFASPLTFYAWETDDTNAAPGRLQQIALTQGTPVSATVRITNVEITPLVAYAPPRRSVRATQIQAASVMDVWIDDPR